MTTDNGQGAGDDQKPQDGAGADPGTTSTGTGDDAFDKDRALNTIRAQRDSEAQLKKQLAEATAKLKELTDRDLTEQQRTSKELEEAKADLAKAKADLTTRTHGDQVRNLAEKHGFRNPAIAARLIDLKADADGNLDDKAVEAQLKELLKQNPELGGQRNSSADATARGSRTSGTSTDMSAVMRRRLGIA